MSPKNIYLVWHVGPLRWGPNRQRRLRRAMRSECRRIDTGLTNHERRIRQFPRPA